MVYYKNCYTKKRWGILTDKIFIGVDGGGTSTKVIAITDKGKVLGETIGKGTNFYAANMEIARDNFKKAVDSLINEFGITDYEFISVGMSSLDDEPPKEVIESFVGETFNPEKIEMQSDVYMALMGMTLGEPGIMLVSGTGSMAIAIDHAGKTHVLGGWGFLLKDEGSAYYIALEGINAAIKSYEGLAEKTLLENKVLEYFKADSHRKLIDAFYNPPISVSKLAGFAREVLKHAEQGDSVSISIVNSAADFLVQYTHKLINILELDDCIVGMYGGVIQNNPYVSKYFKEKVHSVYPKVTIKFPDFDPEIGAVLFAMKKRGYSITKEFMDNIKTTLLTGTCKTI